MSTNGEDGAAKSRNSAAKVGGEFGAVGGIVVVGGVLVAGIAAGVITCLRRRSKKMVEKKPSENSSSEDKLAVPMSENVEEVEPILEIANMEKLSVENFSPMDLELSGNQKSLNRSKGDESPRSHFSLGSFGASSASTSSDSEDFVEVNQMSFKENGLVPLEENSGKASFDRESECNSGMELVEPEVEYEESVDSFDGLEESEEVGGQKINGCEESGQSSLVRNERFNAEECVEFVSGYREDHEVCIEDDGSTNVEEFHVPIEGIDAEDESSGGRIAEIDVLKVSEFVKEDLCVDQEEKDQMEVDGKEEVVLFNKEDFQEKVSESLNCDKEECWQAVIGGGEGCSEDLPMREGDSSVDFGHCDEKDEHGEVDMSEECLGPIQEQSQQEIVGTNQDVLFCKEECLEEKFESNEGRSDSEESDNQMVDVGYKEEQCGTVVSRDLDYNGGVNHCEEQCQNGELEFSEETSYHTEEEIQLKSVKPNELESTEVDEHCCQDAAPHELSNAKEEVHLCNEKHPEQKTFESNVANSEEKPDEREVDLAYEAEHYQHGTVDSKGFEVLDHEGAFSYSEGIGRQKEEVLDQNCSPINEKAQNDELECGETEVQKEEFLDQNCSPINETAQNKELESVEAEVHDLQDGHGQVSVDVNECLLPCVEQSVQEENVELNVKQCPQEKMDIEGDLKGCHDSHVDTSDNGELRQNGTVDFCSSEGLVYEGGSNNCNEVGQHAELEDSEEILFPINEQSHQEILKHKELDCRQIEVPGEQDGHKTELDGANKEEIFLSNVEQCSQEKTDSEELNCIAAVAHKDEQCQIGTVDSRNFGSLDEEESHENGSCQYEAVGPWELDDSNRDSQSEKGQIENEKLNSKEDIQIEQFENGRLNSKEVVELDISEEKLSLTEEIIKEPQDALEVSGMEMESESNVANSEEKPEDQEEDLARDGEQCQHGTVDSKGLDYEGSSSHSEGSGQQKEEFLDQNCSAINETAQNDELEFGEAEVQKEEFLDQNCSPINETAQNEELECQEAEVQDLQNGDWRVSVDVNEYVLPCLEQSIQEENLELNVKQCLKEKMDTEDDLKGCHDSHVDTAHNGELRQHGTVDFCFSEGLDYKGGSSNCNEVGQHGQLEDSEEILFPIDEQSQQEILKHKDLDSREVEVPGEQDGQKTEIDGANKEENFVSNVEQCSQEKTDSEEFYCIAAVAHKGEQCQIGMVDSRNFGGLDKDESHENGSCQYGAVGPWELDDSNRDSHSEKGQMENEKFNSKEDIQNEQFENGRLQSKEDIENEQFENGRLNSKEVVELDIGLEEKQSLREENIKEPQEALEVSGMEMESEENGFHSKETGVDGDAHIFKENPQEEAMDSNESQNFVEDVSVNHELCEGTTCESNESEFVEENMPIAQEEYKQEIVNPVDIQDSVEINESDELEVVAIPGEIYQGDAVYLEELEPSGNLHSQNEPCEQERLEEHSPPSQEEIVDLKETNDLEYLNQCKQYHQEEIDAKDLGYSSSIVLELSSNDPDCTEAYEASNEDPQTYNKPEVIATKDSEYSYGDTLEKEKHQLETVDQVANKYYREAQEICPEQEEDNEENSSTLTHQLNDQNEASQDISTTNISESCELQNVIKGFKLDDESTDSKYVTPLESEPREVSNTNSITERETKGWDPLNSSQLVSNSEEGKSLWMKLQRPLYMGTRIIVSLFAALLAFLFAYKLANIPENVYAT